MSLEVEMAGEWWYEFQNENTEEVHCYQAPQCKIGCMAPEYIKDPYACDCMSMDDYEEMYGHQEPIIPEICEYIDERPVYFKKSSNDHIKIYVHMNATEFAEGMLMLDG
jgi:hypothetical protein